MDADLVAVGRVGKPHGIHGWITVTPTTDDPEQRFAPGQSVLLEGVPREILDARIGRPLALHLAGVEDRNQAEELRGQWLYVDASAETADGDDEFYDHQLEGLQVQVDGVVVGTVQQVLHLPGQDVLAVLTESGREVLVPFVEQLVPSVDLAAGRVDVVGVEGLFDDAD